MIPLRVKLVNFFCHTEQEFRFDDEPVWLLHGPNGLGKSAVFDGIVYALFGESKRGESRVNSKVDVIRHGAKSLRVEFDFELAGRRFQVWRTRTRSGATTQGASEWIDAAWKPVRDVHKGDDLDEWVENTIGLDSHAFTSCVLLRQGAAEKLVDAKSRDRHELVKSFVDLAPFADLEETIKAARSELKVKTQILNGQLRSLSEVTAEEVSTSETSVRNCAEKLDRLRAAEKQTRDWLTDSRRWEPLERERTELEARLQAADDLARRAAELEQRFARLQDLRRDVPGLQTLVQRESERDRAAVEAQQASDAVAKLKRDHTDSVARSQVLHNECDRLSRDMSELRNVELQCSAERDRLEEERRRAEHVRELHTRVAQLQALDFSSDLDQQLAAAQADVQDSERWRQAVPHLSALCRARQAWQKAQTECAAADEEVSQTACERRAAADELAAAQQACGESQAVRTDARDALKMAEASRNEAIRRQQQFETAAASPVCSQCGQPIDAAHAVKERASLARQVQEFAAAHAAAGLASRTAEEHWRACEQQAQVLDARHRGLHDREQQARQAGARARETMAHQEERFREARECLDQPLRDRVQGIADTTFPTPAEVASYESVSKERERRVVQHQTLQEQLQSREAAQRELTHINGSLAALGTAAREISSLEEELSRAAAELAAGRSRLAFTETQFAEREEEWKTYNATIQEVHQSLLAGTGLEGRCLKALEDVVKSCQEARQALPADFAGLDFAILEERAEDLEGELLSLEDAGVERERDTLQQTRALIGEWRERLNNVCRQIAEMPAESRRSPSVFAAELEQLGAELDQAEQALKSAEHKRNQLTGRVRSRNALSQELREAETRHSLHERLLGLVGREGLQRDLVRDVERRIITRANQTLSRLSAGELQFEAPDPGGNEVFELSVRRLGCPDPIAVANLSGGQRFRVAISLALAICAGTGDGPRRLESIIIDEGFGSLDRDGRAAMVAELRDGSALSQMFKRIILVSHQDDFADAFPCGYRFTAAAGSTHVVPFSSNGSIESSVC